MVQDSSHGIWICSKGFPQGLVWSWVMTRESCCAEDIITYNTLLKGYCNNNNIKGAKDSAIGAAGRFKRPIIGHVFCKRATMWRRSWSLCALDGTSCQSANLFFLFPPVCFGSSGCWYVLTWPGPAVWDVGRKLRAKWCFLQLPLGSGSTPILLALLLIASVQIIVASSHALSANLTSNHAHVELSRHPQCSCELRQLWRRVGYHRQNGALLAEHSCLLLSAGVLPFLYPIDSRPVVTSIHRTWGRFCASFARTCYASSESIPSHVYGFIYIYK